MKREDSIKAVLEVGCMVRTKMPVSLVAVQQKVVPVSIGREIVDRSVTYVRFKLPTGQFLDCRVEGDMSQNSLQEAFTKDPHFKPFYDALNPKKD